MTAAPAPSLPRATSAQAGSVRKTIYIVQILRGVAAAAVVLYHTHFILAKPEYGGIEVFGTLTSRGWMGVNFFFALSGFIILLAHYRDIGARPRVANYAWRRFTRVYPIYWIFTLIYMAAALAGLGYPDFGWDFRNLLASFTLLPFDPAPMPPLAVAWTLLYEVFFYIIFAVLIFNRKIGMVVLAVWAGGITINALVFSNTEFGPFHMWNSYFLLGMGAYLFYRHGRASWALPVLALGLGAFVTTFALGLIPGRINSAQHDPGLLFILAIVFALIIGGATLFERDRSLRFPKSLLLLGDASYSVYLIHSPVLSVLAAVNQRFLPGVLPAELLFCIAAGIAILAGIVAYWIIERPLLTALNVRIGRLNSPLRRGDASA